MDGSFYTSETKALYMYPHIRCMCSLFCSCLVTEAVDKATHVTTACLSGDVVCVCRKLSHTVYSTVNGILAHAHVVCVCCVGLTTSCHIPTHKLQLWNVNA